MGRRTTSGKRIGFSLVEMLIVLTLMSVIAMIAIPRFGQAVADKQLDYGRQRLMALASEAAAVARQIRKGVSINIVASDGQILVQRAVMAGGFEGLIAEPEVNLGKNSSANLDQINVYLLNDDGTRTTVDPLDLTQIVMYFAPSGAFVCEDTEGVPQAAHAVEFELQHDLGCAQVTVSGQGLVLEGLQQTHVQTITDAQGFEQLHPPF